MELRWKASLSASCLHAALCREMGFVGVDREFAELMAEPAAILSSAIADSNLPVVATLSGLVSFASEFDNNRQLVEVAIRRRHGAGVAKEQTISQIAAAIGVLETKILAARPEMVEELALRGTPLQQQWQARGPGLLKQIEKLTAESFLAPAAEVVLVLPWIGGFGRADLKTNRVIFEAVLADPHPDVPEALRLGWLLAQLQADVPIYCDPLLGNTNTAGERLPEIAALAALPVTLAGAETVEWGECSAESIHRAIECWHISADSPATLAETLFRWWQTYHEGTSSWDVAWRALEPLLR